MDVHSMAEHQRTITEDHIREDSEINACIRKEKDEQAALANISDASAS
jgi:hypothetical protein